MPFLFEGRLPDFNLGTAGGTSCSVGLQSMLVEILAAQRDHSYVVNGRFKGGYITRHYGEPAQDTFEYREEAAARVQRVLRVLLETCIG